MELDVSKLHRVPIAVFEDKFATTALINGANYLVKMELVTPNDAEWKMNQLIGIIGFATERQHTNVQFTESQLKFFKACLCACITAGLFNKAEERAVQFQELLKALP